MSGKYAPIDMAQIARDSLTKMTAVAKQAYPEQIRPVYVVECFLCDGGGYMDDGDKCYRCAGLGRVATDGGEV